MRTRTATLETKKQDKGQNQILHAYFSKALNQTNRHKLMKQKTYKIFSQTSWTIFKSDYEKLNWKSLLEFMESSTCREFTCPGLQIPTILKQVEHISFRQLIYMSLSNNMISNVEPVQFMDMPNLQFLMLSYNHLSTAKFLAKINLKKLQYISIEKNFVKQLSNPTGRLNLPKCFDTLKIIDAQTQPYSYGIFTMPESLHFMMKLEHHQKQPSLSAINVMSRCWINKEIYVNNSKIVLQPRIMQVVFRKYQKAFSLH